jgi:hypothetical protein
MRAYIEGISKGDDDMTTADAKLTARLASLTTEQLLEIGLRLNLATTTEEAIVCNRVDRELEKRLTDEEFAAHLEACEAMLDAAA